MALRLIKDRVARAGTPDARYAAGGFAVTTRRMLDKCPPCGLWVFACGAILWKRRFEGIERRAAKVRGWHRSFNTGPDTRYRGNPDAPGIMLSLDHGGQCRVKVLRRQPEGIEGALDNLLRNEPPILRAWLRGVTPLGEVRAIAFVNRRDFNAYCGGLSDAQVADRLAHAVSMWGSMAEYPCNTVLHLEETGIRDACLWRI